MKYAVFSIDDSRKHYTDAIRAEVSVNPDWEEMDVWCVDGRKDEVLADARQIWDNIEVKPSEHTDFPKKGHLGIWYTLLNAMQEARGEEFVTFEDDAILLPAFFHFEFESRMRELPDDVDFFSLFIPRNFDNLYEVHRHNYGNDNMRTCRAYQPYGGVSMYFSPQGQEKIWRLLKRDGLFDQWDNQFYGYSWNGELNGYTSKPTWPDLVRITGNEVSIVQETDSAR